MTNSEVAVKNELPLVENLYYNGSLETMLERMISNQFLFLTSESICLERSIVLLSFDRIIVDWQMNDDIVLGIDDFGTFGNFFQSYI